jgi:hypothetical protein
MAGEDYDAFNPFSISQIAPSVYHILSAKRALTSGILETAFVLVDVVVGTLRIDLPRKFGMILLSHGKDLAVC